MRFQFNPRKAATNLKKHGVSFADAEGVFFDPLAIHREDPDPEDSSLLGWGALEKFWSWSTRFAVMKSG
ncbi:MAG TPA: BrnT family toxin [Acidiferrobacterales bacterium]|nr:BrnT family toxin [Acidiferrobacterales bacterium]